jgi:hypothetical protein
MFMKNKLNDVQKHIIDGALTLWVEAFNAERKAADGKLGLFGEKYADIMANEIRSTLKIKNNE